MARARDNYPERIHTVIRSLYPALGDLISAAPYIPLELRKPLLDACRTGLHIDKPPHIAKISSFFRIRQSISLPAGRLLRKRDLIYMWEGVYPSLTIRSIMSTCLRCFPESGEVTSDSIFTARVNKEIAATQNVWSDEQLFDYSAFFSRMSSARIAPEQLLRPSWREKSWRFAESILDQWKRLSQTVFFPVVQRRRNMSRESAGLLLQAGYEGDLFDLKTLDLELHNMKTGERIQGGCEMRSSWGFNLLEPRAYYCTGGEQYWSSRYVKKLAVMMMDAVTVTSRKRRLSPFDFTAHNLSPEHHLTLWDLSNFTSMLSELRYFLWYTARFLDEYPQIHQAPVITFDYRDGIVLRQLPELLDEYNDTANILPSYSLHRIADKLLLEPDDPVDLVSVNSGLLGVHGNIGFSTTLHGLVTLATCGDPDCCTCVGDDAYAQTIEPPETAVIPIISRLGSIQAEKFDISRPLSEASEPFRSKFLKRPLARDFYGIFHEPAIAFPNVAIAFGEVPPERTYRKSLAFEDRAHAFITQVGAFLWQVHEHAEYVDTQSLDVARRILVMCYGKLNLNCHGALPYTSKYPNGERIPIAVPPLLDLDRFDPRRDDWAEWLFDKNRQRWVTIPVTSEVAITPQLPMIGEFHATSSELLRVLEDIGRVEKIGPLMETIDAELSDNRRRFLALFKGGSRRVYRFRGLPVNVPWLADVYDAVYYSGPTGGELSQIQNML